MTTTTEVDEGPFTLMHHLQSIRQDAEALLARVDDFARACEESDVDCMQVDL